MDWDTILSVVGGTTAVVAAGAWIFRSVIGHLFSREMETFKSAQTRALEELKNDFAKEQDRYRLELESHEKSRDRIREEVIRWANPILVSVAALRARLQNLLDQGAYLALAPKYESGRFEGWAIDRANYLPSSLFTFAQYFCWVRILEQELSFELFQSKSQQHQFFDSLQGVRRAFAGWPRPSYSCSDKSTDRQIFVLDQQAIGEAMIVRDGNRPTCLSYHEFLMQWEERPLVDRLAPIVALVDGIIPDDDCRWERLKEIRGALIAFEGVLKELLQMPDNDE